MRDRDVVGGIDQDIDDVLSALDGIEGDKGLEDHLYERLVDLLLERVVVDLTRDAEAGRISRKLYAHQIRELAEQCRHAGLFGVV